MEYEYSKSVKADGIGVRGIVFRNKEEVDSLYKNNASLNIFQYIFNSDNKNRELVFSRVHRWCDELIEILKRQETKEK